MYFKKSLLVQYLMVLLKEAQFYGGGKWGIFSIFEYKRRKMVKSILCDDINMDRCTRDYDPLRREGHRSVPLNFLYGYPI